MQELSPEPSAVAARVVEHYRRSRRDLPWRRTGDPYAIWVSEIMLQQTRVQTVIPYFERWLERFPTVSALAEAPLDQVLAAWSGLGYYSRARNLHRGAREVVARYDGALPGRAAELRNLPGVGRYTAGAIASIAFGEPAPLVDGNVARVLARVYAVDDDVKSTAGQKALWALAERLVPETAPGDFNQGLMELGATVCTPTSPQCLVCPLAALCRARAQGRTAELPVMPRRKRAGELPRLDLIAAWVERRGRLLLARRRADGLYGGLWELPSAPTPKQLRALLGAGARLGRRIEAAHEQTLSHRRLRLRLVTGAVTGRVVPTSDPGYDRLAWYPLGRVDDLGLSAATRALVEQYRETRAPWNATKRPSPSSRRATPRSSKASTS